MEMIAVGAVNNLELAWAVRVKGGKGRRASVA